MKAFTLRLDDEVYAEFNKLSSIYGVSKNNLLISLIRTEYDKVESDPQVQKALDLLKTMQSMIDEYKAEMSK